MDDNMVRKLKLTIRRTTPTRPAICIIITQAQNENQELEIPVTVLEGWTPGEVIESSRFARDLGSALIIAAYFMDEWSKFVDGKR